MLWVLFLPEAGATRRGGVGQDLGPNPYYTDEATIEKVWEHTASEVEKALVSEPVV